MTDSQNSKSLYIKGFAAVLIALSIGALAFQLTNNPDSPASSPDGSVATGRTPPTPTATPKQVGLWPRKPGPRLVASAHPLPLSEQQKVELKQVVAMFRWEEACQQSIDLKIENATVADVMARVEPMLPTKSLPLQVRETSAVRLSFDLKQTRVGDILANVAALSGSRLYMLPQGLLMAPEHVLSEGQQWEMLEGLSGEWAQGGRVRSASPWVTKRLNKLLTQRLSQELTGKDALKAPKGTLKTTVGQLSQPTQMLLRQMAVCMKERGVITKNTSRPARLDNASPLTVEFSEKNQAWITLAGQSSQSRSISASFDAFYGTRPKGKGRAMMQWLSNKKAAEVTSYYRYGTDSNRVMT
ncbi:hypothetical protein EON83_13690 [bacterium]|nr:MAG: hypothetical protein EON83_13690 [bacterium]